MTGDRYLNLIMRKIQRNYRYPDVFRRDGLVGSVVFQLTLARSGEIVELDLVQSSGVSAIDLYAEEVIRRSSPVPPVPPNILGPTLIVRALINVGPHLN
jgi:protein TonB